MSAPIKSGDPEGFAPSTVRASIPYREKLRRINESCSDRMRIGLIELAEWCNTKAAEGYPYDLTLYHLKLKVMDIEADVNQAGRQTSKAMDASANEQAHRSLPEDTAR